MQQDEEAQRIKDNLRAAGVAGGSALAVSGPAQSGLRKLLPDVSFPKRDSKQLKKIKDLIEDKGVYMDDVSGTDMHDATAIPEANAIFHKDIGSAGLAHELGHIDFDNKKPFNNPIKSSTRDKITKTVGPLAAGTGILGHQITKEDNPELAKNIARGTLATTALTSLPKFLDEAAASGIGLKHLHDTGGIKKEHLKDLGKGLASYAPRTLPFLASAGYFGYDALKRRRQNAKESDHRRETRHT